MVRRAADLGMPAVAITDHGVMSGVPELCDACDAVEAETGKRVKPIYGCGSTSPSTKSCART